MRVYVSLPQSIKNFGERMSAMSEARNVRSSLRPAIYWLIVRREAAQEEKLTVDSDDGGKALAVFSFEEEADMFLSLSSVGAEWRAKKTTARELKGMLLGSCESLGFVSLDPLPELIQYEMLGLVSLSRRRFMERFVENAAEMNPIVS